jgi:hypothetical protein
MLAFVDVVGESEPPDFEAGMQCKLFKDIVHVTLHSIGGKREAIGNLLVAVPLRPVTSRSRAAKTPVYNGNEGDGGRWEISLQS